MGFKKNNWCFGKYDQVVFILQANQAITENWKNPTKPNKQKHKGKTKFLESFSSRHPWSLDLLSQCTMSQEYNLHATLQ